MSTNGTYLDRVIDSILLPHKKNYDVLIASEIVDIENGQIVELNRVNCAIINVSNFDDNNPADLIQLRNGNNNLSTSVAEYNRFVTYQNQVFKDKVEILYRSIHPNAMARFEFVIVQLVPKKSL